MESSISLSADMRKELGLEKELGIDDSLVLHEVLSMTSLSDVVKSIFLTLNDFGLLQTCSESFSHV